MPDQNIKTETDEELSSRFEHKSQGMRTRSQEEKKAADEISVNNQSVPEEDKTIKIDRASYRSSSSASQNKAQDGSQKASSARSAGANSDSSKSAKVSQVRTVPAQGASQRAKSPAGVAPDKATAKKAASARASVSNSDGLGITVFMSKDNIPAYELGLSSDEYYVPMEIKSGKVSKISPDQLTQMEADARKKKKKSASKKNAKKKKMTPAQKAVRAAIWLVFWIAVFVFAFVCYKITYNVFYDMPVDPDSTTKIEYTVTADATDESVYEDLTELGVMNCTEFIYKIRAKVFDAEYVEGTYTISDGYNIEKIINILAGYNYSSDDDDE